MNKVFLVGRLTKDPETRYTTDGLAIARYIIAVDRATKEKKTDFISCVAFGKNGEFAEKYLAKGTKILVEGRIQTGSYENDEGKKVYTTDVVVERHEFCESKGKSNDHDTASQDSGIPEGFEELKDSDMPF